MRTFTVFGAVSALLALVLVIGFLTIDPGHKWDAFYVAFRNSADRTMYVDRVNDRTITQDNIANNIARNLIVAYVIAREEGNFDATGEIAHMSSAEVRRDMLAAPKPSGKIVATLAPNGIHFHDRLDLWEVEVVLNITDKAEKTTEKRRKVEVQVRFIPGSQERRGAAKWLNPLGFEVLRYRVMGEA